MHGSSLMNRKKIKPVSEGFTEAAFQINKDEGETEMRF